MSNHDVIVLGAGGVGSATIYQLARRGVRVLGLDRFPAAHALGSSHGQTRLIRLAYYEHPDYVPLVLRAYKLWEQTQQEWGQQLYHETGILEAGPVGGELVSGIQASARQYDLLIEVLSAAEAERRWPGFRFPPDYQVIFEQRSGYLMVEQAVAAQLEMANRAGAELVLDEEITGWRKDGDGFLVETDKGSHRADQLVIAAGAWSNSLLTELGLELTVLRKPLHWFQADASYDRDAGCPAFFYEVPEGHFYGFPASDSRGLKIALHSGGELVEDPLQVDRSIDLEERAVVTAFLERYLPGVSLVPSDHTVCMYTMTPDRFFVIDHHPAEAGVVIAAGLSGHGFKFTPVIAEIICQLLLDGRAELPIDFLSLTRAIERQES